MTENPYSPPTKAEPPRLLPHEAQPGDVVLQFLYDETFLKRAMKRFNSQKRKSSSFIRVFIALLFILAACFSQGWLSITFLVAVAALVVVLPYLTSYLLIRNVSKNPMFSYQVTIVVSDAGVYAEQIHQTTNFKWPIFTECIRLKDGFLLMQGVNQFHWLGDDFVQAAEDVPRLAELLRKHVVNYREAS